MSLDSKILSTHSIMNSDSVKGVEPMPFTSTRIISNSVMECGGDQLSTESDNKTPSWKKRARLCSSSPISGATQTRCRRMKVGSTEMKVN